MKAEIKKDGTITRERIQNGIENGVIRPIAYALDTYGLIYKIDKYWLYVATDFGNLGLRKDIPIKVIIENIPMETIVEQIYDQINSWQTKDQYDCCDVFLAEHDV